MGPIRAQAGSDGLTEDHVSFSPGLRDEVVHTLAHDLCDVEDSWFG